MTSQPGSSAEAWALSDHIETSEEYKKRLSAYLLGLVEIAAAKQDGVASVKDVRLLLAASELFRKKLNHEDSSQVDLAEVGGDAFVHDVIVEMKEFIFMYESQTVREAKNRARKTDESNDYVYLNEAYELVRDYCKRATKIVKKGNPLIEDNQVSLGMVREYILTGKAVMPLAKPSALVQRYKKPFKQFEENLASIFKDLGNFRTRLELLDLEQITLMGVEGLRDEWKQNKSLLERIRLEFLGLPGREEEIFRPTFTDRAAKDEDEMALLNYVKEINNFLVRVRKSPDYNGTPEMEVALMTLSAGGEDEEEEEGASDGASLEDSLEADDVE